MLARSLRTSQREIIAIAYRGSSGELMGLRHVPGARQWCALPFRAIIRDVLLFDAQQVLLAHNHPNGACYPSEPDLTYTRRLALCLDAVGVLLDDHLIVTRDALFSCAAAGLL